VEPVTVTVDGAKRALGLGTTKIYELISSGDLETITIGRRRLVKVSSIKALVGDTDQSVAPT
jgi:excisionase family DNA binding protein